MSKLNQVAHYLSSVYVSYDILLIDIEWQLLLTSKIRPDASCDKRLT